MAKWAIVALAVLASSSRTLAADEVRLVVRTYNTFGVPDTALTTASSTATALLAPAGILLHWRTCRIANRRDAAAMDPCEESLAANELIVRIVGGLPAKAFTGALGYSYVDPFSGSGALATVLADRIGRLAESLAMDAGTILGRAMAHEIGHLLLGSQAHSPLGVMRSFWLRETFFEPGVDDWRFTPQQVTAMRAAALGRHRD